MATKWLSGVEVTGWRNFISTIGPLMEALGRDLAEHGVSFGEYEVLVFLSEAPDSRLRMGDLADALRLSPSGLTRRLDNLVRAGYVERVACPDDRRVMYAKLAPSGMDALRSAAPDHVASVRRHLLDALSPAQISELGEIFAAIRAGLAHDERD